MKFRQRFPPDEPPEAPLTSWALYDGFWPITDGHDGSNRAVTAGHRSIACGLRDHYLAGIDLISHRHY